MAAIAESDDLYAWLIRGFVESGLPDHTRGSREWIATGALNLENFFQDQGAGGILLEFRGQAGESPVPEDDYTYQVVVTRGPEGAQVVVRSEDTLFHHAFPATPPDALAAHILGEVRGHNERFTQWRGQGGATTVAQRRGIPSARGVTPDRALLQVLETLRRTNRSIAEGPANKWWIQAKSATPLKIEAGLGLEPVYATRKAMVTLSAEDLEHADRLRTAGTVLLVSGGFSLLFLFAGTLLSGWNLYVGGFRWLAAQGWMTVASVAGSSVFAGVHLVGGLRLRALKSRRLVGVLAILGMLPCLAPCCGVGFPAGAWVLYLLRDERSNKVFNG